MTSAEMAELRALLTKPVARWATSDGLNVAAGLNWASLSSTDGETLLRCSTRDELLGLYRLLEWFDPKRNKRGILNQGNKEIGDTTFFNDRHKDIYVFKKEAESLRIPWLISDDLSCWLAQITGEKYTGKDHLQKIPLKHTGLMVTIRLYHGAPIAINPLPRLQLQQTLLKAAADPWSEVVEWRHEDQGHSLLFHQDELACRMIHNHRGKVVSEIHLYQADMVRLALRLEPPTVW